MNPLWTRVGPLLLLLVGCGGVDFASEDPGASGVFHTRNYDGMTVYASPEALEVDGRGRPVWTCPVVEGIQVYDTIELWEK